MRASPPFRAFYFDCDSTLSAVEGIDELARGLAAADRARVEALTARAMDGELPLEEAFAARLSIVAPSRAAVEELGETYVRRMVPDADRVVAALRRLGKAVGIVSGGLRPAVLRLARHLGIPEADVHAVEARFDAAGAWAGFVASPLARSLGKREVLAGVPNGRRPLAFVGDGQTDLEAMAAVDLLIGFGGVVPRPKVRRGAHAWLEGPGLRGVLRLGLTEEERARLRREDPLAHDLLA